MKILASLLVTSLLNYAHGSSSIVVTNLARSNPNAIATQSSTCNHGRAHLAIDGNTSGVWNDGDMNILASQPVNDTYGWRVQTFNFHNVEDGRYVRVQKNGNGYINLGEVEVLGWTKSLESTNLRRD